MPTNAGARQCAATEKGLRLSGETWVLRMRARRLRNALLMVSCVLSSGCGHRSGSDQVSIEFTRVPPAAPGGPDKLDIIEGRVAGGRPGQQIVLYAKSGTWWVQPLADEPYTRIRPEATWTNSTHVGTDYAALLVEPGYRPAATTDTLPAPGGGVLAVAVAKGSAASVSKMLSFSGYEWRIREAPSARGGRNEYDASNAWTDSRGALHLRISKVSDDWRCAEITLTRSFGYGTYSFVVRDTSQLEAATMFSVFTWDYAGTDQNQREMDFEVMGWGDTASENAQYVVQPLYLPENTSRFRLPSGAFTHSFRWEAGRVSFRTVRGTGANNKSIVAEHAFTSGVPSHGVETVRINLYVVHGAKRPQQNEAEVVVEKFEYLP